MEQFIDSILPTGGEKCSLLDCTAGKLFLMIAAIGVLGSISSWGTFAAALVYELIIGILIARLCRGCHKRWPWVLLLLASLLPILVALTMAEWGDEPLSSDDDEAEEEVPDDDEEEPMPPPVASSVASNMDVDDDSTFQDFVCAGDPSLDLSGAIDVQVVDIECQLRPRIPHLDDREVLDAVERNRAEANRARRPWAAGGNDEREEQEYQQLVPCMRIYGKLRDGRSVCTNVYGYYPIVHVLLSVAPTPNVVADVVDAVEQVLSDFDRDKAKKFGKQESLSPEKKRVLHARVVSGYPLFPYTAKPSQFIELKLALPAYIKALGEALVEHPELTLGSGARVSVMPFSCIPIVEQFQAEYRISGWGWIKLHSGGWRKTDPEAHRCDASRCDIELDTNAERIEAFKDDSVAPVRNLTFDIECAKTLGLPTPQKNEVILISCVCTDYARGSPVRKRKLLFQLGSSEPVADIKPENGDVHLHFTGPDAERRLLNSFGRLVRDYDPDYLTGHNVINFDIPYIVERANILGCSEDALFLGRRGAFRWAQPRRYTKQRKNGDSREMCTTDTPGRAQLDTMNWVMGQKKERSYSLNYLARKYLNDSKMDVSPNIIKHLWETSDATRRRLAEYGLKDSVLTEELVCYKEFDMVCNSIEESRQTRVPAPRLLKSGMQAKVWGRILEKARSPHWDDANNPVFVQFEKPKARDKDDKFCGAEVLQPIRGFYLWFVVCGDFRSLYPSIIILLNICFSTIIMYAKYKTLPHNTSPSGSDFVDKSVRRGLLAQIEEELMAERDEAKRQLKAETDEARKRMLDSRQNKIKLICNSVYGILSASGGRFVRIFLGLAVTSQGRKMIMAAKRVAEGAQFSTDVDRVIYGDTDSIMIALKSHVDTEEKAFTVLSYICDAVSWEYPADSPVLMQAEKVMRRMIMINKKRYLAAKIVAAKIEREDGPRGKFTGRVTKVVVKPPELLAMGIEMSRRDNCPLVPELMESIIKAIVIDNDISGAKKQIQDVLREMVAGRIDIGKLVISKSISKAEYKSDPIQVILAKRMAVRDPGYKWSLAERIPYVIVSRAHYKLSDQAEDPLYAIEHELPLDYDYYIKKQLAGPVSRILMWIVCDRSYREPVRSIENRLREVHEKDPGNVVLAEQLEKQLEKALEAMHSRTVETLFGAGVLATQPRKVVAGTRGIASFFKPAAMCARCKAKESLVDCKLCKECMPDSARCLAIGCRKSVTDTEDDEFTPKKYCTTCEPCMGVCGTCGRFMPLISDVDDAMGSCQSCAACVCYACGQEDVVGGLCQRCRPFVEMRRANQSAAASVDIEDLMKKAEEAKRECFDRCGRTSDEISCVSRECTTLYKRATIAAQIKSLTQKK